jgi:tRNA pseudouridine38-40 synthase
MPRYKLTLEYDGTPFVGWQRQENGLSVQQALEVAIEGFCGEAVRLQAAGRTDAGVHATGQVAHCDLARDWPEDTVRDAVNFHLKPRPVVVVAAEAVGAGFEARFSATRRHYLFRILDRRPPSALRAQRVWHVPVPLDAAAMHRAAQALIGRHDFSTFRASECQADSPVRTLDAIAVERIEDEVRITVSARSFLHHQVRSMAGSLKRVGDGKWPEARIAEILAAADRKACGPVAPPHGLYLTRVDY